MQNNRELSPKNFNLMVVGQIITLIGSGLLRFVLSLYVMDITGRADIFATLYAISSIPLLLSPLGGAIADRFNRRNLMVLIDFTSGVVVLGFILMLSVGHLSVFSVGVVMVLLAIISSMESPLSMACIPSLVEEEKLEQANGIISGIGAVSQIVAPVLGGILYGALSLKTLVICSCAAFFLASFMESFIHIPFVKREFHGRIVPTIIGDLKEGFVYVVKESFILKSIVLAALLNLILTPLFVVGGPIILRMTMQSTDTMYGVGMGLIEFATILGALTMGFFAKKMQMKTIYRWLLVMALLLLPMALSVTPLILGLGYYPSFILFIVCAIPIAMALTIMSIFVITRVQKKTPNENLGKVMAIIIMVSQCAAPIGQVIYGVVFETFSTKIYLPTLFASVAILAMAYFAQRILKNEEEIA